MNTIETIIQFKQLLDQGIISQADFDAKKQEAFTTGTDKGDSIELLTRYKGLLDVNAITQDEFRAKKQSILATPDRGDKVALLRRYKVLADREVITQEEFDQKKNSLLIQQSKSAGKSKKRIKAAIIAVCAVAIIAVAATMLMSALKFKKLPGGVKMGDSRAIVVEKANKIERGDTYDGKYYFEIEYGKVYGYNYSEIDFWMSDENSLYKVVIAFSDPKLDLQKLVKGVSRAYGKNDKFEDGEYIWDEGNMEISVSAGSNGKVYLYYEVK